MRLGLIKKSMVCILSLSFCAVLASCGNSMKVEKTSTKTIFNNADIQAYAKKNVVTKKYGEIELHQFKQTDYTIYSLKMSALLKNATSGAYQLYIRYNNKYIDLAVDESESIISIKELGVLTNSFGYIQISYSTGKTKVVDFDGNTVVEKTNGTVTFNNNYRNYYFPYHYTGTYNFYDLFQVTTTDETTNIYYKVDLTFKEGIITNYVLTKLEDDSEIDYSRIVSYEEYEAVKEYDCYFGGRTFYAKDLKGNITANATIYASTSIYYFLDDTLFYQTITTVSSLEDYTYYEDGDYYVLKTYNIDLKTGAQTEVKDYKYLLENTIEVNGYDEKNDRTYTAAIFANYRKIENKRLALANESGMFDGKGNLISNKLGEKGYYLDYFNDRVYLLNDGVNTSIIDNKGKVKYTYNSSRGVILDRVNSVIFLPDTTGNGTGRGYFVDSDLKIALNTTYYGEYISKVFKNGSFIYSYNSVHHLGKIVNGTLTTMDNFTNYYDYSVSLVNSNETQKYVNCATGLVENNIYLVQTKVKEGESSYYHIEIYSYNGTQLGAYDHVTSLTYDANSAYFLKITTTDGTYVCTTTYINNPA